MYETQYFVKHFSDRSSNSYISFTLYEHVVSFELLGRYDVVRTRLMVVYILSHHF